MKPLSLVALVAPLALAAAALGSGCASAPDRYYTLSAPVAAPTPIAGGGAPLAIEIAPIALPERLARPQMLVRKDAAGAEVRVLEQHRWAASFEIELRDALASGVAARLGATDATRGGRRPDAPTWRIAVQVREFEAIEGSRVDAAFGWRTRRSDSDAGSTCQWRASEPAGPDTAALAAGAQRVTARLAEVIAQQVRAQQADPSAGCVRRSEAS